MNGYVGRILCVDMGECGVSAEDLDRKDCTDFIGGMGINLKLLLKEMDPAADPLGPGNVLAFGSGPLVGTYAPTASRSEASARSPLTGLLGTSNSGYQWGADLKYAGFDHVLFRGAAEKPVYLLVGGGIAEIHDAGDLWGKDAWETIRAIKSRHGEECSVACIGPAGERLVRYASIENGFYGAWGRTGLGAVMGAKKLKAVAVLGGGDVRVADPAGFRDAVAEMRKRISGHITYKPWREFGSMLGLDIYYGLGVVSQCDQTEPVGEEFIRGMGKANLLKYKKKGLACAACPIACAPWVEIQEGPYAGLRIKGIEIVSTLDFGARLGIKDLAAVAKATEYFQKLGIDCSTAAASIAFAIRLFREGIIDKSATDGVELNWGDEAVVFELMRKIALREGFGDLLAEGPVRMAEKIGRGAGDLLLQTRGLETSARDPRVRWDTWSFGALINPRGGDHLRVQAPVENLRESAAEGEYFHEPGIPKKAVDAVDIPEKWKERIFDFEKNRISIPHMAAWSQDHMNVVNSMGTCIRPPVLWSLGPTIYARLLSSLTGLPFDPENIMKAGERISAAARLFNAGAGERRGDIRFGSGFYKSPLKGRRLDPAKVDSVLDRFFEVRGWDPGTALPTAEKLRELGLDQK
ncbi:MAG: aldehyde ferredoxin oxidoreductase C-terminal domain-containing protein [Syntrophales bacterium]|nr:aldehyde ferredoxin oxidoreductase C-terminal domain-containing protein [Syntrophales bacterium]